MPVVPGLSLMVCMLCGYATWGEHVRSYCGVQFHFKHGGGGHIEDGLLEAAPVVPKL